MLMAGQYPEGQRLLVIGDETAADPVIAVGFDVLARYQIVLLQASALLVQAAHAFAHDRGAGTEGWFDGDTILYR